VVGTFELRATFHPLQALITAITRNNDVPESSGAKSAASLPQANVASLLALDDELASVQREVHAVLESGAVRVCKAVISGAWSILQLASTV
jgi:hypothetical protein